MRRSKILKKILSQQASNKYLNIIGLSKDNSHIFEMSNAIKKKELLCMHADRFVEGG